MKHSFETHSHTMFCEECLRVDLTIFSSVGLEHGHWRILAHAVPKIRGVPRTNKPCVIWAPWQIRL